MNASTPTPAALPVLASQWRALTAELMTHCSPTADHLAELVPGLVERIRCEAFTLAALVGAWQVLHTPQTTPIQTEV